MRRSDTSWKERNLNCRVPVLEAATNAASPAVVYRPRWFSGFVSIFFLVVCRRGNIGRQVGRWRDSCGGLRFCAPVASGAAGRLPAGSLAPSRCSRSSPQRRNLLKREIERERERAKARARAGVKEMEEIEETTEQRKEPTIKVFLHRPSPKREFENFAILRGFSVESFNE